MAIGAVGGERHSEGMVFPSMLGSKEPMAVVTASPAALTSGDGNQCAGRPMTRGATAVLLRRATNRHPVYDALGPGMTARTIGRESDQGAVILGGVPGRETAVAGIARAAARVTNGGAGQGAIGVVASGTGIMNLRVIGVYSVAGGRMAAGTVGRHRDLGGMVDAGMIVDKGSMAG